MYIIESRNILTPQNGLNIYRGRTQDSILLTEIAGSDSMDLGVKTDAPELLAGVLKARRNKGIIILGNMGDPYNKYEEEYLLTRNSLKVIENYDHGVIISTYQNRILRDIDVLKGISRKTKCVVEIKIPTLDDEKLKKIDGPETLGSEDRLRLIKDLRKEGIDVIATMYPIIPFVNDDEKDIINLIQKLAECDIIGIDLADMRLAVKKSVRDFFYKQYEKRFPKEYEMYVSRNDKPGELLPENRTAILDETEKICKELGIMYESKTIKAWKRQYENKTTGEQMSLFDFAK